MSADPTGDLAKVYNDTLVRHQSAGPAGAQQAALEAVERAINHRWLDMLPAGSLMCGCGGIVQTDHQCANCDWAGDGSKPPTPCATGDCDDIATQYVWLYECDCAPGERWPNCSGHTYCDECTATIQSIPGTAEVGCLNCSSSRHLVMHGSSLICPLDGSETER